MEGGLLARKHLISQFSGGASREASSGEGARGPQVQPSWGLEGFMEKVSPVQALEPTPDSRMAGKGKRAGQDVRPAPHG